MQRLMMSLYIVLEQEVGIIRIVRVLGKEQVYIWEYLGGKNVDINQQAFFNLIVQNINRDFSMKKPMVRLQSGVEYVGEWSGNNINGEGIMFFPDGTRYQGYWQENKLYGKG